MIPKEKAKEMMHYYLKELLSAKYSINGFVINDLAKQCALISLQFARENPLNTEGYNKYLDEVKQEIEKL